MIKWIEGSPPSISPHGYAIAPGTLIQHVDGEILLVGDCSSRGGSCDCCPVFAIAEDIARYTIVYTKEN